MKKVILSCLKMNLKISHKLRWKCVPTAIKMEVHPYAWKCVPTAIPGGVDISEYPGCHLLRQMSSQ